MWIVWTMSGDGKRKLWLSHGAVTVLSRQKAAVYKSKALAEAALTRIQRQSDIDSSWRHGCVEGTPQCK